MLPILFGRHCLPFHQNLETTLNDMIEQPDAALLELTTEIVTAYVSHNAIGATDLPKLIAETYAALGALNQLLAPAPAEPAKPAVAVKKSVTHEHLVCLEDGQTYKSLKRHLRTHHDLTPEQYREKWALPADYPMVAPGYSARRSTLALENGLGRKPAPAEQVAPTPAPAQPGRKKLGLKFTV